MKFHYLYLHRNGTVISREVDEYFVGVNTYISIQNQNCSLNCFFKFFIFHFMITLHNFLSYSQAATLCKEFNVTDYYLDSCIFDLVLTGDPSFRIAAQAAQKDLWQHDPIGAQTLLQNCSDPPCIWEIKSRSPLLGPSLTVTILAFILLCISTVILKLGGVLP